MSNLRWWQRPFTFVYGDGTVKEVELKPIKHLTRDLRTEKGIQAYEAPGGIQHKLFLARAWLAERVK
jgi:hypothetical protein